MDGILSRFAQVRIINLSDRTDRRREMIRELTKVGAIDNPDLRFFNAFKPHDKQNFPSIGARGCYMSHLDILRSAMQSNAASLLILEDDLSFSADFRDNAGKQLDDILSCRWDIFYGAYRLDQPPVSGAPVPSDIAIGTTPFIAFNGAILPRVVDFLEGILRRPAGSADYGPMHVDGAYSVFRLLHPDIATYVAVPQLGFQRSSRSDISDHAPMIDKLLVLRGTANLLRRGRAAWRTLSGRA